MANQTASPREETRVYDLRDLHIVYGMRDEKRKKKLNRRETKSF